MSEENDINRDLLLLAGDINDCKKDLSGIRDRIQAFGNVPAYAKAEIINMAEELKTVQLEYAEAVNLLCAHNKDT